MAAGAVAAARGCLLGLVLGDAVGATSGLVPDGGPLPATGGGQLACFTTEGLIRADVAAAMRGDQDPVRVVWHAYRRWAAMQQMIAPEPPAGADGPGDRWPDGWLADVAALTKPRGSVPEATEAPGGRPAGPPRSSLGPRSVTRTLPVGLYARGGDAAYLAAEIAALTHRDDAVAAAAVGAATVQLLSEGAALDQAVQVAAEHTAARLGPGAVPATLAEAVQAARLAPGESTQVSRIAADGSASAVLAGGLYVAGSFPEPHTVRDALLFGARAGDGGHVATVAGALLGAAHGPDALPVDWLSRLELVWVADTLARDLVRQLTETPAGAPHQPGNDPHWWSRYPGW